MGNTPGVVEEPIEPIDEPMKEGISPMGAAGKLLVGCFLEKLPGASMVSEGCGMMLSNAVTPVYCTLFSSITSFQTKYHNTHSFHSLENICSYDSSKHNALIKLSDSIHNIQFKNHDIQ